MGITRKRVAATMVTRTSTTTVKTTIPIPTRYARNNNIKNNLFAIHLHRWYYIEEGSNDSK